MTAGEHLHDDGGDDGGADWRGPKVLKGRTVLTGRPYARWSSTSLSAPPLLAA